MPILFNADDAGLHPLIDEAIGQCVNSKVVNSVSVIANSPNIDFNLISKWQNQNVKIGAHLSWVELKWITKPYCFKNWKDFLWTYFWNGKQFKEEVYIEGKAQIELILNNGIALDHIDSHQHVHHFPGVWDTCIRLQREFRIKRIRCAKVNSWKFIRLSPGGILLQTMASFHFNKNLLHCCGLKHTGRYTSEKLIQELKDNLTQSIEFIVHPGINNAELTKSFPNWKFDWETETKALLLRGSVS